MRLSEDCEVQRDRKHRRCGQFRLYETVIAADCVFAAPVTGQVLVDPDGK
jgi:hypothetical protein